MIMRVERNRKRGKKRSEMTSDGDDDANDEVHNNRVVVIGLTAWVSWGDTGLDGLAESSCWKMIRMMLLLHYRVCHRELINHSCT